MRGDENGFKGLVLKVVISVVAFLTLIFAIFSWKSHEIPPGAVGVYIDKPYIFGHGGVREEVIMSGRIFTWQSTAVQLVSVAPWTIKVKADDFMSSNKVPLDFDIAITIQIDRPQSASRLISDYNGGPLDAFERVAMQGINRQTMTAVNPSGEFMSFLRDGVRKKHMDEFIIAKDVKGEHSDAISDLEKEISIHINEFLKKENVPVVVKHVAMGRANPPDPVKAAMERTAEQVQLQTTEVERTLAQKARKAAEEASAEADNAQQRKLRFNNAEYLRKLELETVLKICGSSSKDMKDVDGGSNSKCILNFGGALPVLNVK